MSKMSKLFVEALMLYDDVKYVVLKGGGTLKKLFADAWNSFDHPAPEQLDEDEWELADDEGDYSLDQELIMAQGVQVLMCWPTKYMSGLIVVYDSKKPSWIKASESEISQLYTVVDLSASETNNPNLKALQNMIEDLDFERIRYCAANSVQNGGLKISFTLEDYTGSIENGTELVKSAAKANRLQSDKITSETFDEIGFVDCIFDEILNYYGNQEGILKS
jgi:hypothetical protein